VALYPQEHWVLRKLQNVEQFPYHAHLKWQCSFEIKDAYSQNLIYHRIT